MRRIIVCMLLVLSSIVLISCSSGGITKDFSSKANEQPPSTQSSGGFASTSGVRDIEVPPKLVGSPDRIYVVKDKQEKILEPGTDSYNKIIGLVCGRFPKAMKEAAMAIVWVDDGKFNWGKLSDEFDFLRLSYDTTQTVKMNCMNESYKDLPAKEISFNDIIFPLTGDYSKVCMIGTSNTFGVLDNSSEILSELLSYAG